MKYGSSDSQLFWVTQCIPCGADVIAGYQYGAVFRVIDFAPLSRQGEFDMAIQGRDTYGVEPNIVPQGSFNIWRREPKALDPFIIPGCYCFPDHRCLTKGV